VSRAARAPKFECAVQCAPGLERFVRDELATLGIRVRATERGVLEYRGTHRQLYATNLWSRCAHRILVRLASFDAEGFADLERHARKVPWEQVLSPGHRAVFRVSTRGARLRHTTAIAERLSDVISDRFGQPAEGVDAPEQLFVARNVRDHFTISADSSGVALYKRGWRQQVAKAPLRETLAAAMLVAAGWDGSVPLVDPFCGSGTIAIEAALLACRQPPGAGRSFAFADWPSFQPGTWASLVGEARSLSRPGAVAPIVA
jgi:putative N6-adenine-specific DNA methylase